MWHFAHYMLGYLPWRCCVLIACCWTTKQLWISKSSLAVWRHLYEKTEYFVFYKLSFNQSGYTIKSRSGRLREGRSCGVGVHYLITDIDLVLKLVPLIHLPPWQSGVYTAMFCTFLLKTSFGLPTLLTAVLLDIFRGGGLLWVWCVSNPRYGQYLWVCVRR